jgi:hypothetical protein
MLLDDLYNKKYLIFLDIEFQNFQPKNQQVYHILELGLIIFEKGKIDPIVIEHINFPILEINNMRLFGCEYSNVSEKTEKEMEDIQDKFIIKPQLEDIKLKQNLIKYIPEKGIRNLLKKALDSSNSALLDASKERIEKFAKKAMYNYYYNRFSNEYKKLFNKQINLYKNDSLVKKRLVDPREYLLRLNNYFKDGILVHKEGTDLEALRNDFSYYKVEGKVLFNYDIAIHNGYFSKIGSASLHKSYLHLYEDKITKDQTLLKYHDKLIELVNKQMPKFRAHNPLVDAFMTIWVYVLMK